MNLNILHMIFSIEKGGAETYLYNIVDNLKKDVCFYGICNHKGYRHEKLAYRCKNVEIIKMKNVFDIRAARKIAAYCKDKDIDIIQTHFLRENYIAILSKIFNPKVKVIWTTHLIQDNNSIVRFFNKIFSRFVDKIICVSKAVKNSLIQEGIPQDKTQVIYNGVDTDYFRFIDSDIREKLSIPRDTLLLATISRFHKDKGHDFLVEVLKELKNHISNFKALLVGEGDEKASMEKKVEEYGLDSQVIFLGHRDDILKILSAIDIYISPSVMEAISFSILEALSCGNPVIATEVGGVPEIFEKGNCGALVPFGDVKTFAKAIVDLYNNRSEYKSIKSNCRGVVEENFSQANMLKETYSLYSKLSEK